MRYRETILLPTLLLVACSGEVSPEPGLDASSKVSPGVTPDQARALREAPPPESDLPPTRDGTWSLACGAAMQLEPGGTLTLFTRDGARRIGGEVVGDPAVAGDAMRFAFGHAPVARPETVVATMACVDGAWGEPATLVEGPGSPDRVAISSDGAMVVWFSGASGLTSLWAVPFEGGDAQQLTNLGVTRDDAPSGQPPQGFVPPPHRGAPSIEALDDGHYRVIWDSPNGEQAVELP